MTSFAALLLTLLLASPAPSACSDSEPPAPLTTDPFQQSLLVGSDAKVACRLSDELAKNHTVLDLAWFLPNGSRIDTSEGANITAENGTLTALHLTEGDSGDYVCSLLPDREFNASATLRVYAMPSYLTHITVVYAVDGALLLVFLALGIQSLLMAHRRGSGSGDKSRKQHQHQHQQHQHQQHPLHHSRTQSRANRDDFQQQQQQQQQEEQLQQQHEQQQQSWHRQHGDAEAGGGGGAESEDGGGGALVKSHRHHSTVPKPAATEQ